MGGTPDDRYFKTEEMVMMFLVAKGEVTIADSIADKLFLGTLKNMNAQEIVLRMLFYEAMDRVKFNGTHPITKICVHLGEIMKLKKQSTLTDDDRTKIGN